LKYYFDNNEQNYPNGLLKVACATSNYNILEKLPNRSKRPKNQFLLFEVGLVQQLPLLGTVFI
jgi:hypothetical protein